MDTIFLTVDQMLPFLILQNRVKDSQELCYIMVRITCSPWIKTRDEPRSYPEKKKKKKVLGLLLRRRPRKSVYKGKESKDKKKGKKKKRTIRLLSNPRV